MINNLTFKFVYNLLFLINIQMNIDNMGSVKTKNYKSNIENCKVPKKKGKKTLKKVSSKNILQ